MGVNADRKFLPEGFQEKVGPTPEAPIPEEIAVYLAKKYHYQIKKLSELFGGYTLDWLKDVESILKTSKLQ